MKIIMTKDEVIHAFLNSEKVRDAVLSYHGATNHEGTEVAIEGEENYDENYGHGVSNLTSDCLKILAEHDQKISSYSKHIACVKRIKDEYPGASLTDCKARYDHWRENDYGGNI